MAQFVECLSSRKKALVLLPTLYKIGVVVYPVIPALGRWRQKDQKFKIIPTYTVNFRPARDKWNLVSNNIKTPQYQAFQKTGEWKALCHL